MSVHVLQFLLHFAFRALQQGRRNSWRCIAWLPHAHAPRRGGTVILREKSTSRPFIENLMSVSRLTAWKTAKESTQVYTQGTVGILAQYRSSMYDNSRSLRKEKSLTNRNVPRRQRYLMKMDFKSSKFPELWYTVISIAPWIPATAVACINKWTNKSDIWWNSMWWTGAQWKHLYTVSAPLKVWLHLCANGELRKDETLRLWDDSVEAAAQL